MPARESPDEVLTVLPRMAVGVGSGFASSGSRLDSRLSKTVNPKLLNTNYILIRSATLLQGCLGFQKASGVREWILNLGDISTGSLSGLETYALNIPESFTLSQAGR